MRKAHRVNWLFPFLLVLFEISIYLSNDMYLPALPDMMHDLHLTATEAQHTVMMWFLGSAFMPLIMGALADRYGRRPTLLIGGFFYVASTIMCALAVSEYTLLPPRFIEGAMVSSMMVAGYSSIHELYEHKEAIRMLALMSSISVLAPALGPLLGAVFLLFTGWRSIFWFISIFASTSLVLLYRYMPETLVVEKRQPLHLMSILRNYWQVLKNKNFMLLMIVLGLTFAGFISWITAGPLLVIDSLGYSKVAFGWMQAAVFGSYIFGNYIVDKLLETNDAHRLVNIGLVIAVVSGLVLVLVAAKVPDQFSLFLIAMVVYSFGSAMCFAPLNRLIIEASDQPMGIRVAMFTTGLMGSGVLGSGIASVVYDGTPISLAVIIAGGVILAGLCLSARVLLSRAQR